MYYEIKEEKDLKKVEEFFKKEGIENMSFHSAYDIAIFNEIDFTVSSAEYLVRESEEFKSLPEEEQLVIINTFIEASAQLMDEMNSFELNNDSFDTLKEDIEIRLKELVPEKITNLF